MTDDSTLPRRLLGRKLLEMREAAKLSRADVGKAIHMGANSLWRYESGAIGLMKPMVINELCRLYGTSDEVRAILLELAEEARKPSWWYSYGDAIPSDFEVFVGLEQSASSMTTYQPTLLPGMLQTPGYRRAMILTANPQLPPEEVDRLIDLMAKRQARLEESADTFMLRVVLDEAAIRRVGIGAPSVMTEQLEHLVTVSKRPNVSIRIVPLGANSYIGLQTGPFVLLEFPPRKLEWMHEPPLIYVECFTGDLYLGNQTDVDKYRYAYAAIEKAALSEAQSRALCLKIAKEL
jgi:transcriptional regulator with XRE-family HTH domain